MSKRPPVIEAEYTEIDEESKITDIIKNNKKYDVDVNEYNDNAFWAKIKKYAKTIGQELLEKALLLYYALDSPQCSTRDKTIIYGALAYLISPIDAIPDLTPVFGYADDIGVVVAAIKTIAPLIDDRVKQRARDKTREYFG